MQYLDKDNALRLADAATMLLDAARETSQREASATGRTATEMEVLALAAQVLFFADFDLRDYGKPSAIDNKRALDRLEGMARGIGVSLGMTANPILAALYAITCTDALKKQMMATIAQVAKAAGNNAP